MSVIAVEILLIVLLVIAHGVFAMSEMALVVDECGSIQGLVTLHDILEAVVGDVPAAGKRSSQCAVQRDDGPRLLDGLLPVDEIKERFHLGPLPGEDGAHQTFGRPCHDAVGAYSCGSRSFCLERATFRSR